jgi:FkbM family methyltransferase
MRLLDRLEAYLARQIDETRIAYQFLKPDGRVMLDVGAHHGWSLEPFAKHGWEVYAFEPDPANRAVLSAKYSPMHTVTIVPVAVSDRPGSLTLYASKESTGISSLAPFTPGHEATATVNVITLSDYMAEHDIKRVDFLKIDVEGFERNVLAGYNWMVEPRVIELEFEDAKTIPLGYKWQDLADGLVRRGYTVIVSEWAPIVQYGSEHHSWRRFAPYPTTLIEPDGWGNLLGFKNLSLSPRDIDHILGRTRRNLRFRHTLLRALGPLL